MDLFGIFREKDNYWRYLEKIDIYTSTAFNFEVFIAYC